MWVHIIGKSEGVETGITGQSFKHYHRTLCLSTPLRSIHLCLHLLDPTGLKKKKKFIFLENSSEVENFGWISMCQMAGWYFDSYSTSDEKTVEKIIK